VGLVGLVGVEFELFYVWRDDFEKQERWVECEGISVDQSVRALVKEGVYNTLACDIVSIQIGTLQV
jgi:hypothetical protein